MEAKLPDIGKISPEIFDHLILPRLGRKSKKVLIGPQHGVDVGIVDIGGGNVMATTCDPVFIVPEYGFERSAWFATHILASDAATSGLRPTYMCMDLNLPLSITLDELTLMWKTIHKECQKIGISIISGHTARYEGCNYPMVGGATVMSIGPKEKYVTPTMAQVGDVVIVTKGAAIEASGIFAVAFRDRIIDSFGEGFAVRAEKIFYQMSVVEDCMTAVSVGTRKVGITSMHDATECGVWGGLYEVAQASQVGMHIEKDKIIVLPEVEKICQKFEMDPYSSISEGTLIITCRPQKAELVVNKLKARKIPSSIVGEVIPSRKGIILKEGSKERKLEHPRVDPFWIAFAKALGRM